MGVTIPILQIRNKSILVFDRYVGNKCKILRLKRQGNMKLQKAKAYSGLISGGMKKRMTKAITLLTAMIEPEWIYNPVTKRRQLHKLSFITLTVSDYEKKLSGKEAHKQLLSHFLQWLRRTKGVNTYIWKAEHQRNGQIHYHITTPTFVHYQEIRDKWNNLQRRAGLLDRYSSKTGHYDANSTDIHEVRKIHDLAAYMIKYLVKSYQNKASVQGKVWDCSENLKSSEYFTTDFNPHHQKFCEMAEENELAKVHHGERYTIVRFSKDVQEYLLTNEELAKYQRHIYQIKHYSRTQSACVTPERTLPTIGTAQLLSARGAPPAALYLF